MTSGPIVLDMRVVMRARMSGVERWAGAVCSRLLRLRPGAYAAATPPARVRDSPAGQVWEQAVLPAAALSRRASLVFCPANLAPLAWPRNVIVMHDAAVLRTPEAYSRAYRAWHARAGVAAARRAVAVLTVSEFSRRELCELAGLDAATVHVVGGGVDARFHPRADAARTAARLGLTRPYVLTVAMEDRRKNLGALAPVVPALAALGIDVVHAGDTRRQFMGGGQVGHGVRSLGYVDDDDMPGLYAGARALVMPSLYEGFGLPCLEAMACATPVVASDRGALPEACGGAARLVDPTDSEALIRAVVAAATDEADRARWRTAGLARAAEMTWDRVAERVDALLARFAGFAEDARE